MKKNYMICPKDDIKCCICDCATIKKEKIFIIKVKNHSLPIENEFYECVSCKHPFMDGEQMNQLRQKTRKKLIDPID